MSSLRETIASMFTDEGEHFECKLDKILAALQTAVLAAAPKERTAILSLAGPEIANSYMDGFNMCRALYIVALQELFESEQL